jgi:hypothetical protein
VKWGGNVWEGYGKIGSWSLFHYSFMNPLQVPIASVPPEELLDHMAALKAHLIAAPDPNAANVDGQTCLLLALGFCIDEEGERLVTSLLERGADPNRPSAMANFQTFMTAARQVAVLERLIEAGLNVNGVYTIEPGLLPTGRGGRITLLDYALDVDAYLNRRVKNDAFVRTIKKHAGSLSGRRRFVADVIAVLKANGAVSAMDE